MNKPMIQPALPEPASRIVPAAREIAPQPHTVLHELLRHGGHGTTHFQRALLRSAAELIDVDALALVASDDGKLTVTEMALDARHNGARNALATELRLTAAQALLDGSAAQPSTCMPGATAISAGVPHRPLAIAALKFGAPADVAKSRGMLELVAAALHVSDASTRTGSELAAALRELLTELPGEPDALAQRVRAFAKARQVYLCDSGGRVLSADPPATLQANGPLARALRDMAGRTASVTSLFERMGEPGATLAELLQADLVVALKARTSESGSQLLVIVAPGRAIDEDGWALAGTLLGRSNPRNSRVARPWPSKGLVGAALLLIVAAGAMFVPVPDRIRADVVIEPDGRRFVTASFAGVVGNTTVAPGDIVRAGDVVATLEGEAILLAREAADARAKEAERKQDAALREKHPTEFELARIEGDGARADRDLLDWQIAHLTLTSPVDGVVLSNEFEHSNGAPVREGDEIVEIAPLSTVRLRVDVPVVDLGRLPDAPGAEIHLDGVPGGPTIIDHMERAVRAEVVNGQTVVPLRGTIANPGDQLRPGLSGVAVIATGTATLGEILFRHAWQATQRWWL